jgi:hypothetical protein
LKLKLVGEGLAIRFVASFPLRGRVFSKMVFCLLGSSSLALRGIFAGNFKVYK